jgi:hypothetical protein
MPILLLQLTQAPYLAHNNATTRDKSIEVRLFDRYGEVMLVPALTLMSNNNVLDVECVNANTITSINADAFRPTRSRFPHAGGDSHRRENDVFC